MKKVVFTLTKGFKLLTLMWTVNIIVEKRVELLIDLLTY